MNPQVMAVILNSDIIYLDSLLLKLHIMISIIIQYQILRMGR